MISDFFKGGTQTLLVCLGLMVLACVGILVRGVFASDRASTDGVGSEHHPQAMSQSAVQAPSSRKHSARDQVLGKHDKNELLKRSRLMNLDETKRILSGMMIPAYSIENASLGEALELLNSKIAEQTPKGQPCLKIRISPRYREIEAARMYQEGGKKHQKVEELQVGSLSMNDAPAEVLVQFITGVIQGSYFVAEGGVYIDGPLSTQQRARLMSERKSSQ